jgi:hypothetical protein
MNTLKILFVVVLVQTTALFAQFVPVTSGIRVTTETVDKGKVVKSEKKEGVFLRTSDGSTLTHFTRVNGVEEPGIGELLDNRNLASYQLFYQAHKAVESNMKMPEPVRPDMWSATPLQSLGERRVGGVDCTIIPLSMKLQDKPEQRIGQMCVSPQYGLILGQETAQTDQNGSIVRSVMEMYDVKLNASPDPNLFELRRNFTVFKAEHPNRVPNRPEQ